MAAGIIQRPTALLPRCLNVASRAQMRAPGSHLQAQRRQCSSLENTQAATTAVRSFTTSQPSLHPHRSNHNPSILKRRSYSTSPSPSPSPSTTPLSPPSSLSASELVIFNKLAAALSPQKLEVRDISGGCGSMYGIDIVAEGFRGLSVLKQQRLVNGVLGEDIKGWHGVQLRTGVPS